MHSRWSMLLSVREWKHPIFCVPHACIAAIALVLLVSMSTQAGAYPSYVNKSCKRDYYKLCAAYSVGTPKLRRCMESKRRSLSRRCIDALRRARLIPKRYLKR